jgi:hypothetical protein
VHLFSVLTLLEELEMAVGRLYRRYSEALEDDPAASAFFFRLNLEERSHASIIRYQRKIAWQNPNHFTAASLDMHEVEEAIRKADTLASSPNTPTLAEALAVAAEFESGAAESHCRIAVETEDASFGRLVGRLGSADKTHAEMVREFAFQREIPIYSWTAYLDTEAASA